MSFIDSLKNFIMTTEQDVISIVTKIKTESEILQQELDTALHWIASNAPTIVADIQTVTAVAETVGVAANPGVAAAIMAANTAVTALNAFAAASNSGKNDPEAVIAGYVAVKQAQAAAASALASTAGAPVK